MEKSRQFVIFGNFNKITFDNLNLLSDIKEKYAFRIDVQQDIISNMTPINTNISSGVSMRPVFKSIDNKTTILFGSSRIHIQQLDSSLETYDDFNKLSIEIISSIYKIFNLTVNRLAINGSVLISDIKKINTLYKQIFKDNDLFPDFTDDWQFRINNKVFSKKIDSEINQIISFNRTKIYNTNDSVDILLLSYDYNTQINSKKLFDLESINIFNIEAKLFRTKFLEIY